MFIVFSFVVYLDYTSKATWINSHRLVFVLDFNIQSSTRSLFELRKPGTENILIPTVPFCRYV